MIRMNAPVGMYRKTKIDVEEGAGLRRESQNWSKGCETFLYGN